MIYQRAIGDVEAGARASKVKAALADLDPWGPEFWAVKEEENLANMRYRFAPQKVVDLQMKQMVYMGENQWEFKEDADPKFVDQVAGEEQKARLAALRGRPSGSDPEQSSIMQREEVLERAPLAPVRRRSHAHHLKTTFTGLVRGSIRSAELHHLGPWVRMTELLSAFNKHTKQRWGIHEVLALIFQDNKQRFLVAGSEDDPRAEYYQQQVYPLWVRAAHGHSVNLDLDDRDIAVRWFTLMPRDQGPLAPYKGRPCAAIEDVPPRLYHRTVEDAAFQIRDGELTPGFGDSGKLHNYFSSLPLEEMTNQAGVRKDLPIEIVFETSAVLRYAYLFETASDGVLCREKAPGSTILYIRNSAKDEILYSRPTETPASEAAALMDDTSPTQVVGRHPKCFGKHRSGNHPRGATSEDCHDTS